MTEPAAAPTIQERVMREQVAALYATITSSTIADVVVSWAAGWLFWWQGHNTMALVWLGLHTTQLLRYPYQVAYFKDPNAGEHSPLWARRHRTEMLWYSGTWGLAPWLILPGADTSMTAVLVLIVLGVTSTGIPAVAPRWASVMCFALPMVLSLSAALLWQGDMVHVFLAVSCLAYLGVTLHIARSQHALLAQTLQSRFEKEALATELEQQVRLTREASEEKTRFLAAASHDLRQPLHAIGLFGASLERELQGHPVHPQAVFLQEAVRSVHTSLGAMLDISRLDAGVVAPVRQPVALQDILLSLQRTFGQRADEKGLTLRIRSSPLRVNTDPQMLERLLGNLVENAIKYTLSGGVLLRARARGPQVWIEVADTGIGIDPALHEQVFHEFYQVDNPARDRNLGLGIGLSIVRRLSRLLDHPVTLRSQPRKGSRFRVTVPKAPAMQVTASAAPVELVAASALPRRVLLIDDEAIVAQGLMALMKTWQVELLAAADEAEAQAAIDRARAHGHVIDVILSDVRLGQGVDGLSLARRLQSAMDPMPALLMITGETAPDRLRQLEGAGVPLLFKPVDPEHLRRALAQAVPTRPQAPAPAEPAVAL
ncbi:ATP-binding protein [Hydrogenophaga sp. RWCD_12]|uniref:hybrid sensor histidine kinase/response regulator n=1 Tax=Hydrogenophaga sp. RWCD_12 TaxID=3391190 RepID=UPI0039855C6F